MDNIEFNEFMDDLSLSVEEMAVVTGIDPRNVRRIRKGDIDVPKTVARLLKAELFIAEIFHACVGKSDDGDKLYNLMGQIETRWARYGKVDDKDL